MEDKLRELKRRLQEVEDLKLIGALLEWDQSTYMPPGGAEARARQQTMLATMAQEKFVDPEIGRLLDDLQPWAETLPYDSDEASLVRVTRREYERAIRVPPAFMGEAYGHFSQTYQAWSAARPENDFDRLQPLLEKTLDLSRRYAEYFPGYEHIIDPLIDIDDYGVKASELKQLFANLRRELVPLVEAITSQPPIDDSVLHRHYPEAAQWEFGEALIRQLGYDFERGRVDKTLHPFMTKFSLGDARITTRVLEDNVTENLYGMVHEAGHAMYEQGIRMELEGTPLAIGASAAVHESQSRLWENTVGRSRNFWVHYYPKLQQVFPKQLGDTDLEAFYRAINKVQRSLIRTEADEVTYNLHVMIRFDLEMALLEGSLAIKDLPEVWHARYESDLGVRAPDDRDGVMQDVHWYAWFIGGNFQGYTLGNILTAQFFQAALRAHPEIPEQMRQGRFDILHGWLKDNLYQHGYKFTTAELVERATGAPARIEPYIAYLKAKYGEIYNL